MVKSNRNLLNAIYLDEFLLALYYSDGSIQATSFRAYLENDINPIISQYSDQKLFRKFKVVDNELMWNDYEIVFEGEELYGVEAIPQRYPLSLDEM